MKKKYLKGSAFRKGTIADDLEVQKTRASLNMPPLLRGHRECLKCEKEFYSMDLKNQKLCDNCRSNQNERQR